MNQADEKRMEAIWQHQEHELFYWIREHINGLAAANLSIHNIDCGGGSHVAIIYDIDEKSGVIIKTDTTSPTPKQSHEYMMIEPIVFKKIAELYNQNTP